MNYYNRVVYLFLIVSSCTSQETTVFPDIDDVTVETVTDIPSTPAEETSSVSPVQECSNGDKCKPPVHCALYFSETSAPTPCLLITADSNSTVDTTPQGLCCPDVLANRVQVELPTSGDVSDPSIPSIPELDFVSEADLAAGSEEGVTFLETLSFLENKIEKDDNVKIVKQSPEAGHLKVFTSSEDARDLSLRALQLAAATKGLKTRLGLADPDGELRQISVIDTRLGENCPPLPSCPPRLAKYRTHDGSCNNPRRPWLGRAMSPTQRLLHPHYEDGVQAPRLSRDGGDLPSAREISALLSFDGFRAPQDRKLSALVADFGQFLDHDLTLSPVFQLSGGGGIQCCLQDGSGPQPLHLRHPQCMPIEIPRDDPFFGRFGQRCMNFVRTMPALQHNCSLGAIQQMDAVSHWLDASMMYGSEGGLARALVGPRGTLQSSGPFGPRSLLPSSQGSCTQRRQQENPNFCFRSGDVRVNEQPLLTSLSTLFMREHNRIASELGPMHPEWSDDAVYQETRRIVIAELQHIAYNEFLPVLLGRKFMETYGLLPITATHSDDYNVNYDASITNEFAAAAYRLHTLIRGDLRFSNDFGNQRMQLRETLNSPQVLQWPEAGDELLRGQASRPLGAFDHTFSEELTQHLFQVGGGFGLDILSLNIQRGRDHGLPSYNTYRKLCGLPRARGFQDLADTVRPEALQVLRRIYRNVEDIDLYVGGVSEKRTAGALLGHTFLCLVGDQFARLKKGDRFFYDLMNQPSSFSLDQLNEIRQTSLARIICDNSASVTRIQPLVFWQVEEFRNPIVSCESTIISRMNLQPWSREIPDTL